MTIHPLPLAADLRHVGMPTLARLTRRTGTLLGATALAASVLLVVVAIRLVAAGRTSATLHDHLQAWLSATF